MNAKIPTKVEIPPVTKSILVKLDAEAAFRLFTDGIGSWWPVETYSVGTERAVTCKLEGRVGGRMYEILDDGSEVDWGTVLEWDPPFRLVFSWYPGYGADQAQEVEVTFESDPGGTRLDLVHRGWERRLKDPRALRDQYDSGWDFVLGRYLAMVTPDRK